MAYARSIPNSLGAIPSEGSRGFPSQFDFTTVQSASANFDLGTIGLSLVQGIFIDNSNSPAATAFTILGTQQKIVIPPYSQGFAPVMQLGASLQLQASSAGAVIIPFTLLNAPVDLMIWSVAGIGNQSGVVTVSGSVTSNPPPVAWNDKSITLAAAGVSQQSAAANGSRKRIMIVNPASAAGQNIANAESCFINFGAAAGVNDGISIELLPGGSFDSAGGPCPTAALNINAATISHRVTVKEMQ